jgi:hypothetical protein
MHTAVIVAVNIILVIRNSRLGHSPMVIRRERLPVYASADRERVSLTVARRKKTTAARLEGIAAPSGICLSEDAHVRCVIDTVWIDRFTLQRDTPSGQTHRSGSGQAEGQPGRVGVLLQMLRGRSRPDPASLGDGLLMTKLHCREFAAAGTPPHQWLRPGGQLTRSI